MARARKSAQLDDRDRKVFLGLLQLGCSRRMAASYIGRSIQAITWAIRRDPNFAAEVSKSETSAEVGYLKNIRKAAEKEQYWRAAAWALERRNPNDFAPRAPDMVTREQFVAALTSLAETLSKELPDSRSVQRVLKRVHAMLAELRSPPKPQEHGDG